MTKITCDRCGVAINKFPWMQAKFPMVTIMCVPGPHDPAYSIDLCDACSDAFQQWLENDNSTERKTE